MSSSGVIKPYTHQASSFGLFSVLYGHLVNSDGNFLLDNFVVFDHLPRDLELFESSIGASSLQPDQIVKRLVLAPKSAVRNPVSIEVNLLTTSVVLY